MTTTQCTEHLSCAIPTNLNVSLVELVDTVDSAGRPCVSVQYAGRELGAVRDDGFRAHTGEWCEDWVAFAGGAMVPTGDHHDRAGVLRELVDYCSRVAFHTRLSLHS